VDNEAVLSVSTLEHLCHPEL